MTVQTLRLGRERFVLLKEKDYRQLLKTHAQSRLARKARRPTAQDLDDVAEAKRREKEPVRPYAELRRELGLK